MSRLVGRGNVQWKVSEDMRKLHRILQLLTDSLQHGRILWGHRQLLQR